MADDVSYGGVANFDALANPLLTSTLRSLSNTSLYLHATAVQAAYDDRTLPAIARLFAATAADAEFGFQSTGSNALSFFHGWVQRVLLNIGFRIDTASINGFNPGTTSQTAWDDYVDLARSVGIGTVSPVFSPNSSNWSLTWSASSYDPLRAAALYGGGLTIDAPPGLFGSGSSAYRSFTENEIRWANQQGLETTVIVSPWGSPANFLRDTAAFFQTLRATDALPSHWVVENYQTGTAASTVSQIGAETTANTVNNVALWLARNGSTTPEPPVSQLAMPSAGTLTTTAGQRQVVTTGSVGGVVTSHGEDTIIGGTGAETVWAGAASISVQGGAGSITFHAGSGVANIGLQAGTIDTITLGIGGGVVQMAGTDSIVAGMGSDIFQFTRTTGGHDLINGFKLGTDKITLLNYTTTTPAAVLAGAQNTATGTVLNLGDGTVVTLVGLHHVDASLFG